MSSLPNLADLQAHRALEVIADIAGREDGAMYAGGSFAVFRVSGIPLAHLPETALKGLQALAPRNGLVRVELAPQPEMDDFVVFSKTPTGEGWKEAVPEHGHIRIGFRGNGHIDEIAPNVAFEDINTMPANHRAVVLHHLAVESLR